MGLEISERNRTGYAKPIIDLTTNEVFSTLLSAATSVNESRTRLHAAIRNKRLVNGHAFWYADDPEPPAVSEFHEKGCKARPILDYTTGERFETMAAAATAIGATEATLFSYVKEMKRLKGHAFWWADDPEPPAVSEFREPTHGNSKPVVDLTTGETFGSMTAAANSVNIKCSSTIPSAIKDKRLVAGHAFWYADDPEPPAVGEFREPARGNSKPVVDLTTGETFETVAAAAKAFGASTTDALSTAIKHKRLYNGHAFWWADDPEPPAVSEFKRPAWRKRKNRKKQRNKQ